MKIADFFASVRFKVNTKELRKVETQLKQLSKSFNDTARQFEQATRRIDRAMGKMGTSKKTAPTSPTNTGKLREAQIELKKHAKLSDVSTEKLKRQARAMKEAGVATGKANARLKEQVKTHARLHPKLKKTNFLTTRVSASFKQMAGNYLTAFAAIEGLRRIKQFGQDIEGAKSAMLAVSDSAMEAGKDFEFVKAKSVEAGLSIAKASKDFVKLKAVGKSLSEQDLQGIFNGIAEAGVVLQLSQEDITGSFRAVQQMLAKGAVNMEDFRQQLAERMPFAIEAMAKAAGVAETELFDLIGTGTLGADTIAKFGKEMSKLARKGGAYEKMLKTNRVAQNRLNTSMELFANKIFESGFGESLTELFDTLRKFFTENEGLAIAIGNTFAVLIDVVTGLVDVISMILKPVNSLFIAMNKAFGGGSTGILGLILVVLAKFKAFSWLLSKLPKKFRSVRGAIRLLGMAIRRFPLIAAIQTAIFLITELIALLTEGVQGAFERAIGGKDYDLSFRTLFTEETFSKIKEKLVSIGTEVGIAIGEAFKKYFDEKIQTLKRRTVTPIAEGAMITARNIPFLGMLAGTPDYSQGFIPKKSTPAGNTMVIETANVWTENPQDLWDRLAVEALPHAGQVKE